MDSSAEKIVGSLGIGIIIFAVVFCIAIIIAQVKIFQKAGKPGFYSIIPFLNTYTLFDIAIGKGWLGILSIFLPFIPVVGYFASIGLTFYVYFKLGQAFGKSSAFGIGLIFLSPIFLILLGFSDDQYIGPQ